MPWLGDLDHKQFLWPDFGAYWPNEGPAGIVEPFTTIGPVADPDDQHGAAADVGRDADDRAPRAEGRPSRHDDLLAVRDDRARRPVPGAAGLRVHARLQDLNLKLTSGVYGSTFFMLTGFHGFHVTVGAIMLSVMLARIIKGHFTADHHFAFEGAAWYWHFVDVVWLLLYVVVYWL